VTWLRYGLGAQTVGVQHHLAICARARPRADPESPSMSTLILLLCLVIALYLLAAVWWPEKF
jgi:hypothetical protein